MSPTISDRSIPDRLVYGFGQSAVGTILVAVSDRGVAAILLGSDPARLAGQLAEAFPSSLRDPALAADDPVVAQVAAFIDDPSGAFGLPLDLRGSADERQVWDALRTIPSGEVRSYGQIAKALDGRLTPVQVGAACASNVLAVAIPCHRVVKADGGISGYRWGVHRKRHLLLRERAA